jgi:plastocyanin
MVGSASAYPLLSVGSNANYQLNASIQSTQSCSATPATSIQVNYTQLACGPYQPRQLVSIYDNGTCVSINSCYYSPSYYYYYSIQLGTTVMWFNYGSVAHTVTSCSTPVCTFNKVGLQTFDSGAITHYGSFSVTFNTAGNYTYYDSLHPSLRGNLIVSSTLPLPTPVSSSFMPTISLDGSIGWTVNGLDNSVAVLNVSHQVSIIASAGPLSFTPATETGSFSQSIDLATRVESSGTATSVILGIIQRMFTYYPGYYGYGYPSALGQLLSSQKEIYTFWWVNGPLSNGQPVEILTGYASVTGSEIVNLGPGNNRNAWIVESELSQSLSTTSPPVVTSGGSSDSSFKLDLKFDYDQASDLLLKSSAVVSVTSAQVQPYNPGDYLCGPSGCFPVSNAVTVTHHMSASIPVTLQLTTTNLDLSKRDPQGSTGNGQTSPATTLPLTMSLLAYAGIGIVGAGAVGTIAWLLRRRTRIRAPVEQPGPLPGPSPAVTSA